MLEVTSLGSGSSGNAFLVRTSETVLLVDCGVGVRRMSRALEANALALRDINALLISHEHSDHVRELSRFTPAAVPVHCTRGTASAARVPREFWNELAPTSLLQIADIEVRAIPVSHDAREPCGFYIRTSDAAVTILTDLGCASRQAAEFISASHLVVIEANHDEAMVRGGPYPPHLQRRILSDSGHLSNRACGDLLSTALKQSSTLPTIWLAHLSETNNRPNLAKRTVARRLSESGFCLDLQTLPRREIGPIWRPDTANRGTAQLTLDLFA